MTQTTQPPVPGHPQARGVDSALAPVYLVHGLLVASGRPLPCPRVPDGWRRQVDLDWRPERNPGELPPLWQLIRRGQDNDDGHALELYRGQLGTLLRFEGMADFQLSPTADRITVSPHPAASDRDVMDALLGLPFAYLLFQRGRLPLHASAVYHAGSVTVFLAPSLTGKSTLAAACLQLGAQLVADDLVVIQPEATPPLVEAGLPLLRLDGASHAATALTGIEVLQAGDDNTKALYNAASRALGDGTSGVVSGGALADLPTYPLGRLYLLHRADTEWDSPNQLGSEQSRKTAGLVQPLALRPADLAARLSGQVFGFPLLPPEDRALALRWVGRLMSQVPVMAVRIPNSLDRIGSVAEALLAREFAEV